MTKKILFFHLMAFGLASSTAALAADWGYDDVKKQEELKAAPAKSLVPGQTPKSARPAASSSSKSSSASAKTSAASTKPSPIDAAPAKPGNPFARTPAPQSATQEVLPTAATATMAPPLDAPKTTTKASTPKARPGAKAGAKPGTTAKSGRPGKSSTAAEDWVEMFELVSKEQLTADQKARFRETLAHTLASEHGVDYALVTNFWPEVQERVKTGEDQKTAFSTMFRALLRFVAKSKNVSEEDSAMLSEVLGPERVAVAGSPPLTEEAVDAYGDMACFLYEQAHPGKSVDAVDNRAVFASVVARKYNEAPSDKDKLAIVHFALKWSKFRVTFLSASAEEKKTMYEDAQAGRPSSVKDELVTKIFTNGPWK